jgi:pimeloyl-ACP methyl ester carboxylesterase
MPTKNTASNITAPTQFLEVGEEKYAFRRFGAGRGLPLLCLQHFTGTMDNWDPAVTDPLADGREVILFENAGVGRSGGTVPTTMTGMAAHALAFLDGLGIKTCDVLGFSLGGMVAQQMAVERPSVFRRMILVGTAPRGGEELLLAERELAERRAIDLSRLRSWLAVSIPRVIHRPGRGLPRLRLGIRTVLRVSRPEGSRSRHRRNGGLFHGPP